MGRKQEFEALLPVMTDWFSTDDEIVEMAMEMSEEKKNEILIGLPCLIDWVLEEEKK